MRALRNLARRVALDRRGVSALEFALIAPVMLVLFLGTFDIGNAAFQYIELNQIVRAGGQYAMRHAGDTSGIQTYTTAAATAAGFNDVTVAAPQYFCSCDPNKTLGTAPVNCQAAYGCIDQYVVMKASRPYQYLLFNVGNVTGSSSMAAGYVERFQ